MSASGRSGRLMLRIVWRGRPRSMTCATMARRTGSASSSQPGLALLHGEGDRGVAAQRGLEGGADRARVRDVGAHVAAGVDPRHDEVGDRAAQAEQRDAHAVRRACRRRRGRGSRRRRSRGCSESARWMVMPRATALVLRSGAMVVTSPRPSRARRSTAMPGASMPSSLVRRICRVTTSILAERRGDGAPTGRRRRVDVRVALSDTGSSPPVACRGDRRPSGDRQD